MNRTTKILTLKSAEQIPTIEDIRAIPRQKTLKLIFEPSILKDRGTIGESLKNRLDGFQVGIHLTKPEISIAKLITDKEIETNQEFFEKCAKDYRKLSIELINKLADKLRVTIDSKFPLLTFTPLKQDKRQNGQLGGWYYFLHGFHCGFKNKKTGQLIETHFIFALEFGDLDPYFFTKFIKTTPEYQPLTIDIYEDYADGVRINKKMLSLGKFERITSTLKIMLELLCQIVTKIKI